MFLIIENIKPTALGIWSSSSQLEKTATGASVSAAGLITTTATHGFVEGDISHMKYLLAQNQ